jgi:hypothetical protein
MNLYQKLIEVRKSVPYLQKENNTKGNASFAYSYVSSSQTLASVRMKMDELGIILEPEIIETKVTQTKSSSGATNFFTELIMTMTFVNAEKPEEKIVKQWYAQGTDSGEKGVGKALTYGEKYFILKFFNIATDKDDPDSFQDKVEKTPKKPNNEAEHAKKVWNEERRTFARNFIRTNLPVEELKKVNNGKTDLSELSDKQLQYFSVLANNALKLKKAENQEGGLPV